MSNRASAGIMLDAAKSPTPTSGNQREVTVFVSQKTSASAKVQVCFVKGYASGSPNIGFGAMLTGSF